MQKLQKIKATPPSATQNRKLKRGAKAFLFPFAAWAGSNLV
ncbi:hypothetical protein [Dysgonomonas termitidis]|uniref:Uncharacterized protein n=1 Tax=Dysgonomonas termitidis TaxID=1516126 RepID=A0ABV9L0E2_9BACT